MHSWFGREPWLSFFSLFNSFIFLFSRESEAILSWDRGASQSNKSIYGDRV